MDKLVKKISNGVLLVLTTIAVVAGLIVAFKDGSSSGLDTSFSIIYALLCIAILLILFFAVTQMLSNKKQVIATLIMLAVCAVIILVSYLVSPSELSEVAIKVGVSEGIYKWVGTALNIAYIAFIGLICALIGSIVYIKIKNR